MYSIFEIFLLCSILLFVIYGVVFTLSPRLKYPYIGVNVLYFFYIILVNAIFIEFNTAFLEYSLFNNLIVKSSDSNIFTSVIVFLAAIVSLVTMSYNFKLLIPIFEFSLLNLIVVLNSSLIISSNNIFLFFLLIELQSMLLFILTAVNRRNRYSVEAGLKYFILGSFSSIMMLLGICLIYLSTSFMFIDDFITFSLISTDMCNRHISIGCELGITLILISFFFKVYSAPFHFWVSDIYQGASIGSVLVFSTNSFLVLFYAFFKLYFNMFSMIVDFETLSTYITVFGALSMVCGSIGGLVQRRIKRLVAYSSINVTGYLLLVIANGDVSSISSMFVFIFTYIISIFGIFSILSNLLVKNKWYLDSYKQLTNFSICSRWNSFFMGCFLFSLGGIPPFFGFVSKLEVLSSLFSFDVYYVYFFFIVVSTVSFMYYVRIVKYTYSKNLRSWFFFGNNMYLCTMISIVCFFLLICSIFFNGTFFLLSNLFFF